LDVYSFTQLKQVLHYSATQYSTGFNQIINSQALMQNSLTIIAVFFILAAVAKSAQIGLHT
jgi:NADH:ubiquinone oxidoreductase subunit 5 (subunit L)/multisubunit Na+/H+ antiporter MnhA subunit